MANLSEAIIIGGGIGGLTTALALRHAGIRSTVYERAPELRSAEAGNGLVVWHNAVRALRTIGVDEGLRKVGQELDRYQFRSSRGGILADWSIEQGSQRTGAPAYTVSRPALHRMLSDLVGDDLVLGARCTGFQSDADGVSVQLEDGRADRAALLIGADGLRSTVRHALMPYEPPPRFAGVLAWQGVTHFPDLRVPAGLFVNTFGRGRWFVYYRLTDGFVYWDGVLSDRITRRLDAIGKSKKGILHSEFAGWPEPITALIESTAESEIQSVDVCDRDPVPRWSHGRVTLVGDAAHPMTFNLGQGANQAIEGAVVLADCVATAPDVDTALSSYERRRMVRARKLVNRSRANGVFCRWSNPAVCAGRNWFMRAAFDRIVYRKTYELTMDMDF